MGTLFVDNIKHESAQGSGTITLGASGETITTASGAKFSGITGQNYPAFEAYLSSTQSTSHAITVKAQINTEVLDTDSCYDNSTNYRFTPTTAGKYYVYGSIASYTGSVTDNLWVSAYIYKNGSEYREGRFNMNANYGEYMPAFVHGIIDMNGSTDYLELFGKSYAADGAGTSFQAHTKSTYFGA